MEIIGKNIFQVDSVLVKKYYSESDNIKIIDIEGTENSKLCVIYFSSNELYYPNTEKAFNSTIVNRDKYEWINNKFPGASRHIFVRDIQKQWYIEGTSSKYNNPDKVAEYLKELCDGYMIYTLGSSAGGFAAILFGSLIQAKRVYAFNAQLNLNLTLKSSDLKVNPILYKYFNNEEINKYYLISNFLNENCQYFYFQSANSNIDIIQYEGCSAKAMINKIEFKTSNHGFPFLRHNLKHVLCLQERDLLHLSKSKIHPLLFSIRLDGFFPAVLLIVNAVLTRLKKKLIDEKRLS